MNELLLTGRITKITQETENKTYFVLEQPMPIKQYNSDKVVDFTNRFVINSHYLPTANIYEAYNKKKLVLVKACIVQVANDSPFRNNELEIWLKNLTVIDEKC